MKTSIKKTFYINQDAINLILIKYFKESDLPITKLVYDVSDRNGLSGVTVHLEDSEFEIDI